jgi:hypothetical protein
MLYILETPRRQSSAQPSWAYILSFHISRGDDVQGPVDKTEEAEHT